MRGPLPTPFHVKPEAKYSGSSLPEGYDIIGMCLQHQDEVECLGTRTLWSSSVIVRSLKPQNLAKKMSDSFRSYQ